MLFAIYLPTFITLNQKQCFRNPTDSGDKHWVKKA